MYLGVSAGAGALLPFKKLRGKTNVRTPVGGAALGVVAGPLKPSKVSGESEFFYLLVEDSLTFGLCLH